MSGQRTRSHVLTAGKEWATRHRRGEFVGRARELELLDVRLRAALDAECQVVLLAGEPGVGKTRLAEEIVERAQALGMACGWGRATDDEGSPPYWPFRQVLMTTADVAVLDASGSGSSSEVARERFQMFEAVTDALLMVAQPRGLLVVLDDLQWADAASVQLLAHLAIGRPGSRLMVLAVYRDTETSGQEPLRAMLAALAREPSVTRMRLAGLSEAEVATQLAGVTGWAVPNSVAAAVCRRTEGNPFFVGELGALLADSDSSDGQLPDGVRDAVRGRLARLSAPCRAVVSAASVLGSELDAAALAGSTGRELDDVLAALDEASTAGIVTATEPRRFVHDLIREAARLDVSTPERLALHEKFAEYMTGLGDADTRVAEVAFHWLESLPRGDAVSAVSWAERAATRAMAQLAWEEADALYGRALSASSGPEFAVGDRCRLLLARAAAQVRAYDVDAARQSVIAAAEIARDVGDAETIARAALTMEGVNDFLWDPTGRALCEEALAGLPDGDNALRARLLALLVVAGSWRSLAEAEPRSAEALAMAERVGDRRAVVEALRARQMACSGPEGVEERLALGDRLFAVGQDGGDDDAVLWGRLWRFEAFAQLGHIDRAEAELDGIGAAANRLRSPLARWHEVRARATIAHALGRFEEAGALGAQAVELARRAGHDAALLTSRGFLHLLTIQTGHDEEVPDELLQTHLSAAPTAILRALLADRKIAMGDRAEAHRIYRSLPPPTSVPPFVRLPMLCFTADLAAEFGDREAAGDVYRRLSPFAHLFICGGAGVVAIGGSVQSALGVAAAAIGRLDDGVRHLRAAIEINERAGLPPSTASAEFRLAAVLATRRRTGDREEAAALAALARATAVQLGMVPLQRRAQSLADSLAGTDAGPLTEREQQIARLVSQGLTNRQIAAIAHISERTAETHVRNILAKLGFSSRAQIAAWVATH
jgi:DNA-binding CsgD family transcriptional regulator